MIERTEVTKRLKQGEIVTLDAAGNIIDKELSEETEFAQQLGITRPVVFQEHSPEDYERPYDIEVEAFKKGEKSLGEMTPAYAWAMVWSILKAARSSVKTFKEEINLAVQWKMKLAEIREAFQLPEDYFLIDTSGPILHVYPYEESGVTVAQNNLPLQFDLLRQGAQLLSTDVGRGFEAILPTHIQNSGYNTPAHPEMDSSVSAMDAIPSIHIGKYVRVGGSLNAQGGEKWKIGDNAWIGQGSYFISQEHPADRPSQLARVRQETSFPGMVVGDWAWVAKEAKILYRTQYIGEGSVIASQAKVNNWVGDYSLVTDAGHNTFYPLKAFILGTMGIRDTADVLALDWKKVEQLFEEKYNEWRSLIHNPEQNIANALTELREKPLQRVLFIGSKSEANILAAASKDGKYPIRRIDVLTDDRTNQSFIMQALNGMRNLNTRFRYVESLGDLPLGKFYEEPLYDLVIVEASAHTCCEGGDEVCRIFEEASRLVKPDGRIIGTIHDVERHRDRMTLPPYVSVIETLQGTGDTLAVHAQRVATGAHH